MSVFKDFRADLQFLKERYEVSKLVAIFTNRGIHALLCYRIAHCMHRRRVPLFPLILTRIIQVFYSIDIDYKAKLEGGIIIIHGVGLVIGGGAIVKTRTVVYHQVTLGIKGSGQRDGFPTINEGCILCAGAKLFGAIVIGENSIIGANVVVTSNVDKGSLVKMRNNEVKKLKI